MTSTSAFRTKHPDVLAAHQANALIERAALAARRDYERSTGLQVAAVRYPEGEQVVGVRVGEPVPQGWILDAAQNVMLPDLSTEAGRGEWGRLAALGWHLVPLPGLPWALPWRSSDPRASALRPTLAAADGWVWALFDRPVPLEAQRGLDGRVWQPVAAGTCPVQTAAASRSVG